ncbi:N-acetylmuramic acid 6-phosphate etherase [Candidatus Kaiserbacteria bacterium]|nr:N-acetylmuramic acid 6-phosphate etherase [Candidatus Kaiserbacteria bacterium]
MSKNKKGACIGPITEASGIHDDLEKMTVREYLFAESDEDLKVAPAVRKALTMLEPLVHAVIEKVKSGGRVIYVGAGSSGRTAVADAAEMLPTYGLSGVVRAIIAGGRKALWEPVEGAEDDTRRGWRDLENLGVSTQDVVIGVAASGKTPYVFAALQACIRHGITTGCVVCNPGTEMARMVHYPVEVIVGPEIIAGSSRLKAGSAQKFVLNKISNAAMVLGLGRVEGNEMVCMRPTNAKLLDRGAKMIVRKTDLSYDEAVALLRGHEDVRSALKAHRAGLMIKA